MKELINIQQSLVAKKDKHNKFGGYDYRSAEGILESLKPLLKANSCFVLLSDKVEVRCDRYYVVATASLINADGKSISVSAEAREEDTKKGMDAAQITGAASSYARKYALCGLFAIDDGVDPDLTNKHGKDAPTLAAAANKANATPAKPSAPKVTLEQAKAMMMLAGSKEDMMKVWSANKVHQSNPEFIAAKESQKKKLGIQ